MALHGEADYAEFVRARYPRLVRTAVLLGCATNDAEDEVQTALVRCYRSWDRVRAVSDVDGYVYRVLMNSILKGRRRRWWGEVPTQEVPERHDGSDTGHTVATGLAVADALRRLSRDQQAVLVLRYYADLSERQIADVLSVPIGTVKSRTARALAALAALPEVQALHTGQEEAR
jgi:RNA polymerase sigma-70 factor (sigma-E family)